MQFVPIPLGAVPCTMPVWAPLVARYAKRIREYPDVLERQVTSGDVHIALAWDEVAEKAHALIGMQVVKGGDDMIGKIVWVAGEGRSRWLPLLPEVARYLKEHQGCNVFRVSEGRRGWSRFLKSQGFKLTHMTFEREL